MVDFTILCFDILGYWNLINVIPFSVNSLRLAFVQAQIRLDASLGIPAEEDTRRINNKESCAMTKEANNTNSLSRALLQSAGFAFYG